MRTIRTFGLSALITALAACQAAAPVREPPERVVVREPAPRADAAAVMVDGAIMDDPAPVAGTQAPGSVESTPLSNAKIERGTGQFFDARAAQRRATGGATGDVTFNWEDVPVQVVVKAILGDLLGENYVIAPGVQGSVTFSTAKPISMDQARGVLETILQQNNLAMVWKDGRYTILPIGQAIPGNLTPRAGSAAARGYEVRVVPLKYIAPTEMEKLLAPYVRQGAVVRADNARAMIVLAGNAADLQTYLDTIEIFDVDWLAGMSVGIFPLERVEVGTVIPELEKVFGEGGATPLAGMFRFMPIERLNAVLVITPQPKYLEEAGKWLGRLDRGGSDAGTQLFVYYVKNVKAQDLADNLTDIFGASGSSSSSRDTPVGGVAPGLQPVEVRQVGTTPSGEVKDSAAEAAQKAQARANRQANAEGISIAEGEDIRITAIEESNALLIKATPGEYDSILKAIKRLDTVPLQVHVEVKILSVNLTDDLSLGVEWYFENASSSADTLRIRKEQRNFERWSDPNLPEEPSTWISYAGRVGAGGLQWTFLNTAAEALLSSLQSSGKARVLSSPSLVVLNNKEASINVGTQLPVVSSFVSGVATTPTDPNSGINPGVGQSYVQFRNTGITLKVTPRVNPGGLVFMEVSQEDSQPIAGTLIGGNVALSQRQVSTEIAVQSGQTVLLGGLIRETESVTKGGVPGLSKIPVIGALFGGQSKQAEREELLLVITPTVISNADSAQEITDDYRARFQGLKPLLRKADIPDVSVETIPE
ncbi:MAG TPA: type II secretion system secretin GspD [Xanthomonadales bacterium]|nr:type II secretion system secretin GspD [Xanthomonadales bacterium]